MPDQSCKAPSTLSVPEIPHGNIHGGDGFFGDTKQPISAQTISSHHTQVSTLQHEVSKIEETGAEPQENSVIPTVVSPAEQKPGDSHQTHQSHITSSVNSDDTRHPTLTDEDEDKDEDDLSVGSMALKPKETHTSDGAQTSTSKPFQQETQIRPPPPTQSNTDSSRENNRPTNTGFLIGLTISPISSHNQALAKLNQSSHSVDEKDMASALESTVPNLVSNIFSNIQNLTLQTEQNPNRPQSSTLTSIDGSSVDVNGDSKDQITADGQKLFDIWLEHQLETLNLTATMAGHIRKSAGILFRRIIKQYVDRVEKMGGKVEQNIQRATQMALNNTQTLIAFLLKNYVNFAAGIMQILGEQVSRVGKQIDSTGDTIAHMNLNPFDIISNVMESLPNPSDYSKYFRNFGKQLLGDVMALGNGGSSGSGDGSSQQSNSSPSANTQQGGGLITKTIGAISKLGSWLG